MGDIDKKEEMIKAIDAEMWTQDPNAYDVRYTRIWDVLDRLSKNPPQGFQYDRPWGMPAIVMHDQRILSLWSDKRRSIDSQSIECISYVYGLVNREVTSK